MGGVGGSGERRPILRGPKPGMDHQDGGAILHRARVLAFAAEFLGTIRSLSIARGFETEKEYTRLMLACRSSERHSLPSKHRTECALVLHRSPRTGSWILFQSLHAPGSSLSAADRRCARISRRRG